MKKYLLTGAIGLALAFSVKTAEAHDELGYFVLGTIVGSVLARDAVPVAHYAPAYPARVRYAPVYHAPVYYAPRVRHVHYPAPTVVVRHVYSAPPHYYVQARPRHPLGGPPGQRVRHQHKRR
jgi:hypothetical protein